MRNYPMNTRPESMTGFYAQPNQLLNRYENAFSRGTGSMAQLKTAHDGGTVLFFHEFVKSR
jgi:hypothetical protein